MAVELYGDVVERLLEVSINGKLSGENYAAFEPAVSRLIETSGKIKILLVMHDFHGWERAAVCEDIKFANRHCRDVETSPLSVLRFQESVHVEHSRQFRTGL